MRKEFSLLRVPDHFTSFRKFFAEEVWLRCVPLVWVGAWCAYGDRFSDLVGVRRLRPVLGGWAPSLLPQRV